MVVPAGPKEFYSPEEDEQDLYAAFSNDGRNWSDLALIGGGVNTEQSENAPVVFQRPDYTDTVELYFVRDNAVIQTPCTIKEGD